MGNESLFDIIIGTLGIAHVIVKKLGRMEKTRGESLGYINLRRFVDR